jgi:hypothetical protein
MSMKDERGGGGMGPVRIARDIPRHTGYEAAVTTLRTMIAAHPRAVPLLIAVALLVRVLVPAGFMPAVSHDRLVLTICTGTGPVQVTTTIPGKTAHEPGQPQHQGNSKHPCPFGGLSIPALAAHVGDPAPAVATLDVERAPNPASVAAAGPLHLRPHPRGPPPSV